jgi:hypothetical protein
MRIKSLTIMLTLITVFAVIGLYLNFPVGGSGKGTESGTDDDRISIAQAEPDLLRKRIEEATDAAQFKLIAEELLKLSPAKPVNDLMRLLLDRWIERDLATALDFARDLRATAAGQSLLEYALTEAGYFDFRGVMGWINRQLQSSRPGLVALLYESVGRDNPGYALRFIDLLGESDFKERILRSLLEEWGQQDPAAALSWMSGQELPSALADLKASLWSTLMDRDPQEAGSLIRGMQPSHEKYTLARKYAELIANKDIQAGAAWARSLDDADSYGIAITAVYEAWFQKEPDKALIMEQVLFESDNGLRDRLINEIALDIANDNPAELALMIDRLPESAQPDVAEKAVRFWKDRDLGGALQWVNRLASGPVKDRTARIMVEHLLVSSDKEGAMSLASAIWNDSIRYESVRNATAYLYQRNPAEAEQMLEGIYFLSETEKQSIRRHLRQTYQ